MQPEAIRNLYGETLYFAAVRFTDAGSQTRGCLITVSAEKWRKLRRATGTVLALVLAHVILNQLVVSNRVGLGVGLRLGLRLQFYFGTETVISISYNLVEYDPQYEARCLP